MKINRSEITSPHGLTFDILSVSKQFHKTNMIQLV